MQSSLAQDSLKESAEAQMDPPPTAQVPEVGIVVPVYRNAETLQELCCRLRHVLESQQLPFEIIFVDDACPAGSLAILEQLALGDPRVAALALERNVGQHRAVLAGLSLVQGKWVVVMDADLQDPPEAIPDLLTKMQGGYAAVFAGRCGRYESFFRLLTSRLFKGLLHLLCGVPADAGLFVAMNRQMVERLLAFDEPRPFVVAMIGCTGLPLASIPVLRSQRLSGHSAYTLWKRFMTGCLAISWVLTWKWRRNRQVAKQHVSQAPVRAYIGARFVSILDGKRSREATPSTRL
ncbi:MAG: glycosyltransferase family 2 protein [Chloroflexota bacterium]